MLRKLCAKFDTFVTSVTIRPIFCTKRPDYNRSTTINLKFHGFLCDNHFSVDLLRVTFIFNGMYHFSPICDACDILSVAFVRLFGFFSQTVDMRDELMLQDGLIFKASPVVIPRSLHADMKARIHSSHLGTESCLRRARECKYWPGTSAEIKQYISACEICRELDTSSQPNEPLMSHEVPSCPWERVGTHIFFLDGKEYLITIDYCSNFWKVDRLLDNNASTVVLKLKSDFARYGIPDQVVSDIGPQFTSTEFATFTKTWEFDHLPSLPETVNNLA